MHIVLVDWRIIRGQEDAFVAHWNTALHIADRSRMVGEFLSEPNPGSAFPWVTWDMASDPDVGDCTRYINVGLWADAQAFHDEVSPYFDPAGGKLPFEHEIRRRALLTPKSWRTGLCPLPVSDSDGVR